jgi:hypothetical protein
MFSMAFEIKDSLEVVIEDLGRFAANWHKQRNNKVYIPYLVDGLIPYGVVFVILWGH